jgi:hypothetical protein
MERCRSEGHNFQTLKEVQCLKKKKKKKKKKNKKKKKKKKRTATTTTTTTATTTTTHLPEVLSDFAASSLNRLLLYETVLDVVNNTHKIYFVILVAVSLPSLVSRLHIQG